MKFLKAAAASVIVFSWCLGLLPTASASLQPIKISFALPAQNIDFSDLDMRDENNQPIFSPQLLQRFEDVLNRNLNQLLIENLTPLRRAFIDLLSRQRDAFAAWFQRKMETAQRFVSTAASQNRFAVFVREVIASAASPLVISSSAREENLPRTVFLLIASTRLIC
jgi:hypothetical protein